MSKPVEVLSAAFLMSIVTCTTLSAQGSASGCGWINYEDGWFSKAWCSGTKSTGYREWSGTNTTFDGNGGWFYASWESEGGNWIPDISRYAGDPNHWPQVSGFAANYMVNWTGSGDITTNSGDYTFGLKFELADIDHWKDYDMTGSYECYIVTQTSRTDWTWMTEHIGTVYPPGSAVGYDCYMQVQGSFVQLWAVRQENSWDGPVNVQAIIKYWADSSGTSLDYDTWYYQGIFICAETFSSQGWIRAEDIEIPDISVPGTTRLNPLAVHPVMPRSEKVELIGLDGSIIARGNSEASCLNSLKGLSPGIYLIRTDGDKPQSSAVRTAVRAR